MGREVGSRVGLVVGPGNALSGGHGHSYITSRFLSVGEMDQDGRTGHSGEHIRSHHFWNEQAAWHIGLVIERIFDNYLFWMGLLSQSKGDFWCCLCI